MPSARSRLRSQPFTSLAIGFSPPAHKDCSGDCTLRLEREGGKIFADFGQTIAIHMPKVAFVRVPANLALSSKAQDVVPTDGQKRCDSLGIDERLVLCSGSLLEGDRRDRGISGL